MIRGSPFVGTVQTVSLKVALFGKHLPLPDALECRTEMDLEAVHRMNAIRQATTGAFRRAFSFKRRGFLEDPLFSLANQLDTV